MNSIFLILSLVAPALAQDGVRYPAKPGPREFILDEAKLLKPEDAAEIRNLCDDALTKKKAPIIVVTIPSLASHGAAGWPIERYAMNLMGEWGVGWEDWNYGILLLVSPADRKARIELGASWARRKDDDARRVMSERIIPPFKKGDFSRGILEGVKGLHSLALGNVPSASQPRTTIAPAPIPGISTPGGGCLPASGCGLIVLIVGGLIVVMAVSRMARGGTSSWGNGGPGFFGGGYGGGYGGGGGFGSGFGGGLLGGALGSMLYDSFAHRGSSSSTPFFGGDGGSSSSSSDSSFGGGSFGGGFSGGGGATGEW
jgi:uncharacterized protein